MIYLIIFSFIIREFSAAQNQLLLVQTKGFDQQMLLGATFREIYVNGSTPFLSERFNPKEIFIRSTNISRTIASAMANMLGFFPDDVAETAQSDGQGTNRETTIPIHVFDIETDFAGYIPKCPNFDRDYKAYLSTTNLQQFKEENKVLLDLIFTKTGLNIDFETFDPYVVYDLLHIQRNIYHLRTPEWATAEVIYDLKQMAIWKLDSFYGYAHPPSINITRYREMVTRMEEKLKCHQNGNRGNECQTIGDLKFYAYSAHDITVGGLLATLGSYNAVPGRFLRYTVCTTIELWLRDGKPYIKVLLRPTRWGSFHTITQFTTGCPPGEEFCSLDAFVERSRPYMPDDIKKNCGVS